MRQVDFTFGLLACQDQVHQRVIRQIQQARERVDFFVCQVLLMRIEEAREEDVVFEQARRLRQRSRERFAGSD